MTLVVSKVKLRFIGARCHVSQCLLGNFWKISRVSLHHLLIGDIANTIVLNSGQGFTIFNGDVLAKASFPHSGPGYEAWERPQIFN